MLGACLCCSWFPEDVRSQDEGDPSEPMLSQVIQWDDMKVSPVDIGTYRNAFDAPTATLDKISCHVTTLNPGKEPHPAHRHPEEELLIIKEGTLEVTLNGVPTEVSAGGMVFCASNELHGWRNASESPVTYYVLKVYPHDLATATNETGVRWQRTAVGLPDSIWSVESVDANGDGKRDVIAMGQSKVFALLAPDWKPVVLADTREPKMLYCVALDADGDGDQDIALGRYRVPWIEYREALKAGKTADRPEGPDFSVAWIENTRSTDQAWPLHVLDRELNGIHGLCAGDVNGNGMADVIADSINGPVFANSLAWFAGTEKAGEPFERHLITKGGTDGRPHYLDFADVNGDGRGDVLLGDSVGGTFTWWDRGDRDKPWTKHLIAREKGATNIKAADIDGDGTPDVVGSCGHGTGVFWFEGPEWTKHVVDPELDDAHALAVADFDGDGDPDVASSSYTSKVVRWYENDGKGSFEAHDIDATNEQESYDLKARDVDGDQRPDLILAGRETRNVVFYQNIGEPQTPASTRR